MAEVRIRFWAAARSAAGAEWYACEAGSVGEALHQAAQAHGPGLGRVIDISSVLRDGRRVSREGLADPVSGPVEVEVLPPFAGG